VLSIRWYCLRNGDRGKEQNSSDNKKEMRCLMWKKIARDYKECEEELPKMSGEKKVTA